MTRLRQVPRAEADPTVVVPMYDQLFGDRDPVAEPGTATGTPGDWWTVFALVPDVLRPRRARLRPLPARSGSSGPRCASSARPAPAGRVGSQFVFSQHCKSCPFRGRQRGADRRPSPRGRCTTAGPRRAGRARLHRLPRARRAAGCRTRPSPPCKEHLDDEAILELTYITLLYAMHAMMARALRLEYDDRDDPSSRSRPPARPAPPGTSWATSPADAD